MVDADAKALSQRWWDEVWREGKLATVDSIFTDPFIRHSSLGSRVTRCNEYRALLKEFQRTLNRPVTTIDDQAVVGDRIWTRATSRGLNLETGEVAHVAWLLVWRVDGGRIAEQWVLVQVGVTWES